MEKLFVSVEEAADALGVSRNHAYLMRQRGELPTLQFGKRLLVPVKALREMADRAAAAEEAAAPRPMC